MPSANTLQITTFHAWNFPNSKRHVDQSSCVNTVFEFDINSKNYIRPKTFRLSIILVCIWPRGNQIFNFGTWDAFGKKLLFLNPSNKNIVTFILNVCWKCGYDFVCQRHYNPMTCFIAVKVNNITQFETKRCLCGLKM